MKKINKPGRLLCLCGIVIFALLAGIAEISPGLAAEDFRKDLIPVFTALLVAAGAVYFLAAGGFRKNRAVSLTAIILFGLAFRVLFMSSVPVLENDFYRYFWDGGVVASGANPYAHSPEQVSLGEADERLVELKREYEGHFEKINHPNVKTIYPPVAEFFFAVSHKISPRDLTAWRLVLLAFDAATLVILLASLRTLGMPLQNCLVYWWNPLVVKEIFNSAHMDVLAFPFALGAILLFLRNRKKLCVVALSLAAGVKLWPALIFGTFLRPFREKWLSVAQTLIFTALLGAILLPMILSQPDQTSGVMAYGKSWQNNSPFFSAVLKTGEFALELADVHPGHAQKYSRTAVLAVLLLWKLYVAFGSGPLGLHRKALLIVGGGFLLSPTQFPWYFTWLVPFLAVAPSSAFLSLTVLLPLYYLQYYLPAGETFANLVVWIEFVPVWALIFLEWTRYRSAKKRKAASSSGGFA